MPKNVFSVNDKGQINLSIDSFYERYPLEEQFDEVFYSNKYEDHVKDYYQPYCKNNGFTEKQRLYHHWVHYGKDDLLLPYENYEDVTKIYDANIINEERRIQENLGLNIKIQNKKNNSGKITILYKNLEQFELISNLLKRN